MWKEAKGFEASDTHNVADEKFGQYLKNKTVKFAPQLRLQPSWNQPQTSWMFNVVLELTNEAKQRYGMDVIPTDPSFLCIKADIPKFESQTKDFYFFGSKMTKNIFRDYSGDTTLEFWLRGSETKTGIDTPSKKRALIDMLIPKEQPFVIDDLYPHKEFENIFASIQIVLLKVDGTIFKVFELENPIITNVEFGSVSYDSEDGLKISLSVHYDHWSAR